MSTEKTVVLGFTKAARWQGTVLSRHRDHDEARRVAEQWLAKQTDAAVAIADLRAEAEIIDWRGVGWTPLDLEEAIGQAVERHHRTSSRATDRGETGDNGGPRRQ